MISSNQQILIVIVIGIIIIFLLSNRSEGFATSTEAVNNISSLYNASNLTATNINATNNIAATGSMWTTNLAATGSIWTTDLNTTGKIKLGANLPVTIDNGPGTPDAGNISWPVGSGGKFKIGPVGNPILQISPTGVSQVLPTFNVTMTDYNANFRGWINLGAGGQFTKDSKAGTSVSCILDVTAGPWVYATITYIAGKMWLAQLFWKWGGDENAAGSNLTISGNFVGLM
jgi:hypothetical protein